jgi:hypothetical protein
MALTKVGKEGITGISNSSDATAITIDSSENVGVGVSPTTSYGHVVQIHDTGTGGANLRLTDSVSGSGTGNGLDILHVGANTHIINRESGSMTLYTSGEDAIIIDANGHVTMPNQSAFLVSKATGGSQSFNADTTTTITWSDEHFDQNADFASNTFTAPVTGKYQFNVNIRIDVVDKDADYYQIYVVTSNRTYYNLFSTLGFDQDLSYMNMNMSLLADLDASDTCYVRMNQGGGANQSDVDGQTITTKFSGYLAC